MKIQQTGDLFENRLCQISWEATYWEAYALIPTVYGILQELGILFSKASFGRDYKSPSEPPPDPSVGWINTQSYFTEWTYEGTFWGKLELDWFTPYEAIYYRGANGFMGLRLGNLVVGFALHVKIKTV